MLDLCGLGGNSSKGYFEILIDHALQSMMATIGELCHVPRNRCTAYVGTGKDTAKSIADCIFPLLLRLVLSTDGIVHASKDRVRIARS